MDSLFSALRMITPGCYMASTDLKDAYYCLPVSENDQKYLKFYRKSKLYKYTACPMGLCMSPRLFPSTIHLDTSTTSYQSTTIIFTIMST
jgi:hypothetical protein